MGSKYEICLDIFCIFFELLFLILRYRLRILEVIVIGNGDCVVVSDVRKLENGLLLMLRFICKWLKYCLYIEVILCGKILFKFLGFSVF